MPILWPSQWLRSRSTRFRSAAGLCHVKSWSNEQGTHHIPGPLDVLLPSRPNASAFGYRAQRGQTSRDVPGGSKTDSNWWRSDPRARPSCSQVSGSGPGVLVSGQRPGCVTSSRGTTNRALVIYLARWTYCSPVGQMLQRSAIALGAAKQVETCAGGSKTDSNWWRSDPRARPVSGRVVSRPVVEQRTGHLSYTWPAGRTVPQSAKCFSVRLSRSARPNKSRRAPEAQRRIVTGGALTPGLVPSDPRARPVSGRVVSRPVVEQRTGHLSYTWPAGRTVPQSAKCFSVRLSRSARPNKSRRAPEAQRRIVTGGALTPGLVPQRGQTSRDVPGGSKTDSNWWRSDPRARPSDPRARPFGYRAQRGQTSRDVRRRLKDG